ncbi:MAG: imidazoleglycerol-phosphate dehydratase HisB [Candidatus Omnitrophica bacterium]|nr:imidazoleglycerol-phosphate dehydratase HisB [Candidatus Omnitrophota bacterium]
MAKKRAAGIQRKTKETSIQGRLALDGHGRASVKTGIGFLDHMLSVWAKHGLFDLTLKAQGDLEVDGHHTNEDLGLALGQAFLESAGGKAGIARFGCAYVPMDESLVRVVVDFSGRPYLNPVWTERPLFLGAAADTYQLDDARHFFQAFVNESRMTVHVTILSADLDGHHVLEALFKAFGRALSQAVALDPRVKGVPSTKGKL